MLNYTKNYLEVETWIEETSTFNLFLIEVHSITQQDGVCAFPVKLKSSTTLRWELLCYSCGYWVIHCLQGITTLEVQRLFNVFFPPVRHPNGKKSSDISHIFSTGPDGGYLQLLAPAHSVHSLSLLSD